MNNKVFSTIEMIHFLIPHHHVYLITPRPPPSWHPLCSLSPLLSTMFDAITLIYSCPLLYLLDQVLLLQPDIEDTLTRPAFPFLTFLPMLPENGSKCVLTVCDALVNVFPDFILTPSPFEEERDLIFISDKVLARLCVLCCPAQVEEETWRS